ncbi:MAG: CBS domain-containing protein [Desulfobacteraceae bacterium]|nr:CBS domain-containing protein [Desulfobacteraceae bacterium]MBC2749566.1 CBS domain-containing protein [Desulfobacteraceae bacterium]
MLVRNWMNPTVISIEAQASMAEALNLLKENQIKTLPVFDRETLVGVVTDRDLKRASASDATLLEIHELLHALTRIKVRDIMSRKPITIPDTYTVEEAAEVLRDHHISGAPVMDAKGRIVGMISQNDLFNALMSLTGVKRRGIHLAFEVEDRPGSIKDLADIIRRYGGRMASILSSYDRAPQGFRHVYIRAYQVDRDKIGAMLEELQSNAKLRYLVDHREKRREIFTP